MRLFAMQDVRDYLFLINQYDEATNKAEEAMEENRKRDKCDSTEQRFYLTQAKMAKELMDDLGTEVPDDKAKELGFDVV